jgi:hypothetical protein
MTKIQKNKEPVQWLSGRKNASTSDSTKALFKTEGGGASNQPSGSQGPGGRRLRTVDSGTNELFGDDDDDGDGGRRRREREMGRDGDMEEVDFKDVFEDDEQTMDVDDNEDEDAKDLEVCDSKFHIVSYSDYDSSDDSNASMPIWIRDVKAVSLAMPKMMTIINLQKPVKVSKSSCASREGRMMKIAMKSGIHMPAL